MKVYEMMEILGKLPAGDEIMMAPVIAKKVGNGSEGGCAEGWWDPEMMSWDEIEAIGREGRAREVFRLGARKTIALSSGEVVLLQIIGFDHDDLPGGGKALISWDMVGVLDDEHRMNESHTNAGGWERSAMRAWANGSLFSQLPEDLKKLIKPVVKKTSVGGTSKEIVETEDRLWCLSEKEMYGRSYFSASGEGSWYEFYRQEDTPWDKREKNGEGDAAYWWLRSPYVAGTACFCSVYSDGARNYTGASYAGGVAVGFAI